MRVGTITLVSVLAVGVSGCITDKMILTNDQGQTQTCEFTGHWGIVSPILTHEKYKKCVDKAKADGFIETPPTKSASP